MGMLASFWLGVHRVSELVTDVFQKTWRELEFDIELKPPVSLLLLSDFYILIV